MYRLTLPCAAGVEMQWVEGRGRANVFASSEAQGCSCVGAADAAHVLAALSVSDSLLVAAEGNLIMSFVLPVALFWRDREPLQIHPLGAIQGLAISWRGREPPD